MGGGRFLAAERQREERGESGERGVEGEERVRDRRRKREWCHCFSPWKIKSKLKIFCIKDNKNNYGNHATKKEIQYFEYYQMGWVSRWIFTPPVWKGLSQEHS